MITKMGWGVIFLLGGGFAMAGGITSSGLGKFIGLQMSSLSGVLSSNRYVTKGIFKLGSFQFNLIQSVY